MRLHKVVSGGQTGVDRAALDAAMACGVPVGGWCPKGRRAEDDFVPHRYPLVATPSSNYRERTTWNVRDSEATVVLFLDNLEGGSLFTAEVARKLGRPCLVADLNLYTCGDTVRDFLEGHRFKVLNVAGPRESSRPGIHGRAYSVLVRVFGEDPGAGFILR